MSWIRLSNSISVMHIFDLLINTYFCFILMPGIYNLLYFILLFLFFYVKGSSTYLGAASIVHCLENYKPHVVITSRVADASLFLAPMVQYSNLICHSHVCYLCNALFCLVLFMQGEHDEFVWSDVVKLPLPFLSWFVYRELLLLFFLLFSALYC